MTGKTLEEMFPLGAGSSKKKQTLEAFLEERGAEILPITNPWEVVRFRTARGVQVIYKTATGKFSYSDPHADQAHKAWMGNKPWLAPDKTPRRSRKYLEVAIMQRDGCDCFYCGKPFTLDNQATIEHLLALGSGGNNVLANLALAHENCNREADCLSVSQKVVLRDKKRNSLTA